MTHADSSHSVGAVPTVAVVAPVVSPMVAPAHVAPLDQYSFFQALRRIERARPAQPRIGYAHRPADEPVRIGQPAELTFAPSTLTGDATARLQSEPEQGRGPLPPDQLQQRFIGLLGPAGPMPLHITEAVRDRNRHAGDESLQAFLDIFHHRIATLFYRAWSDAQPIVQHDRPSQDNFARFLGALVGEASNHSERLDVLLNRNDLPRSAVLLNNAKRFSAGHFIGTHRHSEGLESILVRTLQAPVKVRPFALRTLVLASEEHSSLCSYQRSARVARRSNCLGQSAQLGTTVSDRMSMIDVHVGPVSYASFQQFLPEGQARTRVAGLVRHYAGAAIDARVTIQLQKEQVPNAVLGRTGQLGRTAWMIDTTAPADRDDYCFEVSGSAEQSVCLRGPAV